MNKSVNINGVKTKVTFEYNEETLSNQELGKKLRYKSSGTTYIVNSLEKRENVFTINGVDYTVYQVITRKVNRSGYLVTGYKFEYNGVTFASEKATIENILS